MIPCEKGHREISVQNRFQNLSAMHPCDVSILLASTHSSRRLFNTGLNRRLDEWVDAGRLSTFLVCTISF